MIVNVDVSINNGRFCGGEDVNRCDFLHTDVLADDYMDMEEERYSCVLFSAKLNHRKYHSNWRIEKTPVCEITSIRHGREREIANNHNRRQEK